eukprot:1141738-Pelagomonas_calceolata.AAC.6
MRKFKPPDEHPGDEQGIFTCSFWGDLLSQTFQGILGPLIPDSDSFGLVLFLTDAKLKINNQGDRSPCACIGLIKEGGGSGVMGMWCLLACNLVLTM